MISRLRTLIAFVALVAAAAAWTVAFADAGGTPGRKRTPRDNGPKPGIHVAAPHGGPLATLERTMCYGECPIYKITVYRDGTVDYDGRAFVKVEGTRTAKLDDHQLRALARAFAKAKYLELDDAYSRYEVTDNPWCHTSLRDGTRTKTIDHYLGDHHAPRALTELEASIDEIVGVTRWIGTPDERSAARKSPEPSLE